MIRKTASERRKVNVPMGDERRGKGKDRRRCPKCGSSIQSHAEPMPGGTRTTLFCNSCNWKAESRQIDEDKMQSLLGFEAPVVGTAQKPLLELNKAFSKASGIKPGDTVEIKPIYTPGSDKALSWIVKKIED